MKSGGERGEITVFGHRGARGIYPENTMAGFQYLQDIGVNAVELDVQNAAGRLTVVVHDPYVTTALTPEEGQFGSTHQLVRHTTAAEFTHLKVGALRPGSEDATLFPDQARLPNERIPTFAIFCEWAAKQADLLVNVEIKSHAEEPDLYDPPEIISADVLDLLEKYNLTARCVLSSFDWRVLSACAERAPNVARGYLTLEQTHGTEMVPNIIDGSPWLGGVTRADHDGRLPQTIAALGGKVWCPYFEDLTHENLTMAQALGLVVNVWTVNEARDISRMVAMGVDGIISDYPARVQNVLAKRKIS